RTVPLKTVAVLADPVYSARDARLQKNVPTTNLDPVGANTSVRLSVKPPSVEETEFPRLVSSLWEGKQIVALVPAQEGSLFLDFAANRATATSPELGTYRFLHFAAHALIDDQH